MLISNALPPLPAALEGLDALGIGLDPFSAIFGTIAQAGASIFSTVKQADIAKKQIGLEEAKLREQKAIDAREWALQQAEVLVTPSAKRRQEQVIGLTAIVGISVILSAIFIISAVKKPKA